LKLKEALIVAIGEKVAMSLAFAIELHSRAVGLVVRDGKHYRFHAAVHEFSRLDGQSFRSPQDAEKAIRQQDAQRANSSAVAQRSHLGQAASPPIARSTNARG
jgi:hypothetical protein